MNRIFGYRNITPFTTMLATARVTSKSNSTIETVLPWGHHENAGGDSNILPLLEAFLRRPRTASTPSASTHSQLGWLMMMVHIDRAAANIQLVHFLPGERARSTEHCQCACGT